MASSVNSCSVHEATRLPAQPRRKRPKFRDKPHRCCHLREHIASRFLDTRFAAADRVRNPVTFHSTTILAVRHRDRAVLAGDGQVTFGQTVVKQTAQKIRRLYNDRDPGRLRRLGGRLVRALRALRDRSSSSIAATSSGRPWSWPRTGAPTASSGVSRRCSSCSTRSSTFLLSGNGDLIEPDDGIVAIGSGGPYALAAAKALAKNTELDARAIAEKAMTIAGEICIYTNANLVDRRSL